MKPIALPIVTGATAAAAVALAGTAHASLYPPNPPAPFTGSASSPDTAQDVVSRMQSNGYRVMLNRIGSASLDQCTVSSITPGQAIVTPVTAGADGAVFKTQYTTVYITADCTHPKRKH
ncbi:hypothetical protein [Mycobacterium sp.]|jgi:hypothetical protein|uniref:hypothetical protein n=1 Tax=Mycobacterium sp. TaxID=1785 RepID=UPI002D54D750|nr:hypothetical protein [Mycobacterium sp.]HZA08447.1 hypothetical protein [Mycobacterium sp.]